MTSMENVKYGLIRTLLFISRVWSSIIFRFCVLLAVNIALYFYLEDYRRYTKLILIVNMAILLIFLPALHVNARGNTSHFAINIFMICIIFILVAVSFYFMPYFFLTTTMDVSKIQKFGLLFAVVALYGTLFLMYGDRFKKLYEWISTIPYLPNRSFLDAVWNLIRYIILYIIVCLPIDLYRVCKGIVLGKQSLGTPILLLIAIIILLFFIFYGRKIKDGALKLNTSLVVLRRERVYLNIQTNIGLYDDIILWNTDRDRILRDENAARGKDADSKQIAVKRGKLEPIPEYHGERIALDVLGVGDTVIDMTSGVSKAVYDVTTGESSITDSIKDAWKYLKENPIKDLKEWLILPEDAESSWRRKRGEHFVHPENKLPSYRDPSYREGMQGRCSRPNKERDDPLKPVKMQRRGEFELKYESQRVHQIAYSLSMWFYFATPHEQYAKESNLLNFSNKLILCMSRDGSTIYVDLDSELLPDSKEPRQRTAKRVFALDTFAHQRWNHVVITTDHTGRMNAFVNSVLVATNDTVLPETKAGNHMIYLGDKMGVSGMARDVYYYNKVLTHMDVSLLYNGIPIFV